MLRWNCYLECQIIERHIGQGRIEILPVVVRQRTDALVASKQRTMSRPSLIVDVVQRGREVEIIRRDMEIVEVNEVHPVSISYKIVVMHIAMNRTPGVGVAHERGEAVLNVLPCRHKADPLVPREPARSNGGLQLGNALGHVVDIEVRQRTREDRGDVLTRSVYVRQQRPDLLGLRWRKMTLRRDTRHPLLERTYPWRC